MPVKGSIKPRSKRISSGPGGPPAKIKRTVIADNPMFIEMDNQFRQLNRHRQIQDIMMFSHSDASSHITAPALLPLENKHNRGPGVVLTFGQGDVGQLGLGPDIMEKGRPALIPDVNDIIDICAGGMHTICLTSKGKVLTFGCNDEGVLGRDTSKEGIETIPGEVKLDLKAVQISAGDSHSAALLEDGHVFAWGAFRDSHGTMGLTLNGIQKVPLRMPVDHVVKITSGADHLVMLTSDGHIYTCGCAEQGQLGRLSERVANGGSRKGVVELLTPALVNFNRRFKLEFDNIWTGAYCTFAREKAEGNIYVFGLNNYNQLGVEDTKTHFHPVHAKAFSDRKWIEMCGGQHHVLALDSNGVVYALGRKEYGRLGLGENCSDATKPTVIPILKDIKCVNIACGSTVSFAVTEDGKVYSWGMGTNSQLGTGDEDDVYEPKEVKGKQLELKKVLQVSGGGQHTVLLAK